MKKRMKKRIKVLYIVTSCKKTGPSQQLYNLISYLDRDVFEPLFVTTYAETSESILTQFVKIVPHKLVEMSKLKMITGQVDSLKNIITEFRPDIIHTSGVLPDFAITRLGFENHVLTSRNYIYDDYPAEFGAIKGNILAKMHLYALKHTKYAQCCSESLHNIYSEKENLNLPFIRNGVDTSQFTVPNRNEISELRRELGLPLEKKIFVYGAIFNERKNQEFLIKNFLKIKNLDDYCLLLLGDGPMLETLKNKYKSEAVIMPGKTSRMGSYLRASDYYVSSSKSEGLPNGVLEAMAVGLPVLLSGIEQHREIFDVDKRIGYIYKPDDDADFVRMFNALVCDNYEDMKKHSSSSSNNNFSAEKMSLNYQKLYIDIVG